MVKVSSTDLNIMASTTMLLDNYYQRSHRAFSCKTCRKRVTVLRAAFEGIGVDSSEMGEASWFSAALFFYGS